ncbi:flagellar basal-body MS-ring/collar protein FliF [Hyphomonas sp.]|uniref:flagellar basal-body MS-ring/collar protein FliF n=1 Tax=Hyphomonas sp. TaxID=87 RepID=UPI0025C1B178|nr:flagellar basal-body MS-ring/collar protein FliF [Hyphomonas sp.]
MTATHARITPVSAPQWQRFALVFAVIGGLLAGVYFFVFRQDYSILFEDLSPAEASLVVSELEAMETGYRIREGGATIEVAAQKADEVRLKIAGSTSAASALVGFELFNESDMGMTEFAQKIKYQRAIQGELARSLLMIEGIENARVHIAVPERAAFRAEQAIVTASVTLVLDPSAGLTPDRVEAIRHLIASSVPSLSPDAVTIFDQNGSMIASASPLTRSANGAAGPGAGRTIGPEGAVAERLAGIVSQVLPGANPEVVVNLAVDAPVTSAAGPDDPKPAGEPLTNSRSAQIILITDYPVTGDAASGISAAARSLIPTATADGPEIVFLVREAPPLNAAAVALAPSSSAVSAVQAQQSAPMLGLPAVPVWGLALAAGGTALLAVAGAAFALRRRRRMGLNADDRRAFAALLKSQISLQPGEPR